ncbi:HAMP domain-containing histidine kinase [Pusillimonas sp. CC-YST705]|uniref:histidine kinase n=1 Tax=Mesopusillimonas faecipullorum TaxID=2755040 RepID=A0ABS8CBB1_9BURK|nr:HAMP domain-containing sensor histidine kinase [Mesopusillimonas faecipullorum]MCB5363326.1 HAMP domain-containing histidine kinase [Mesopusillimonas faecipullorum]
MQTPLMAGHVRQAIATAYVFLLVSLLTMACGAALIESVMVSHVRELVLGVMQSQAAAGAQSLEEAEAALWRDRLAQRTERVTLLVDAQGQVHYGQPGIWQALGCEPASCHGWHRVQWRDDQLAHHRMELQGLAVPLADGSVIFEAYDVLPMLERVRVLPLIAGAGLFVVVLLSIATSMRYGARSLARIEDIRQALRAYAAGDTASRVLMRHRGRDELESLALSVNQALERINALMDEVKDVSSYIAHELRTPLTRLHHRLCAVQDASGVSEDVGEEVRQAIEEVERIQRMSSAVLRIGAIESRRCPHQFEPVQARALLGDVADYFQPLAELNNVLLSVRAPEPLAVYADKALLMQALSNLVDNALKYACVGGQVELFAEPSGQDWVLLGVADRGPGISPALHDHVQMRFVRLGAQSNRASGYGLGLSLVQAIAKLHGCELKLMSNPGRTQNEQKDLRGLKAVLSLKRVN